MKIGIAGLVISLFFATAPSESLDRIAMPYGQKIFASGINVAWDKFGGDVGKYPVDSTWFAEMLQGVAASGGNTVRWWLFTDCSNDPQFDPETKLATGLEASTIANIRKVLDMGYANGVSIDLCLLSFDMMKKGKTNVDMEANKMMLKTDAGRKAFIDNALIPLVTAIGKHPAILNWEIFNEPEGMVQSIAGDWGNMETGIEIIDVQKMVNQAAGAIHRAVPGIPVSNGCWSFIAGSTTIEGDHNYYSDSALIATGGDPDGTLDYYMVHYYEWAETERSPFHHPASYWGLDKPLVIAEFPAKGLSEEVDLMSPEECWNYLFDNGYAGAMGWTYTAHDGFGGLPEAGKGMKAIQTSAPQAVTLDFPPVAKNDWYADTSNIPLTIASPGVLTNDLEPTAGQTLNASLLSEASHGTVELMADGSFTYLPAAGWSGTDHFLYASIGGGGASDTGTVVVRVLDPTKSLFFTPPLASEWQIFADWGKVSVEDLASGMGMNNPQWGSPSTWIVGTGVPIELTVDQQVISVRVRNDPASSWSELKFHLTTTDAVGTYGPTNTTTDIVSLTSESNNGDGFKEYRGIIAPSAAGTYLPALQFVWNDDDENGPNTNHQSILRDIEICPSDQFVKQIPGRSRLQHGYSLLQWNVSGRTATITSPGSNILVEVATLQGRVFTTFSCRNKARWHHCGTAGILVIRAETEFDHCRFILPAVSRNSVRK